MSGFSAPMGLGLDTGDAATLVARGTESWSRAEVRAQSDALVEIFKNADVTQAMVCSDSPLDIIRAIDASARVGVDLYIAHTTIPAEQIADIVATYGIQILFSVPPVGSDAQVVLLGYTQGLISAGETS